MLFIFIDRKVGCCLLCLIFFVIILFMFEREESFQKLGYLHHVRTTNSDGLIHSANESDQFFCRRGSTVILCLGFENNGVLKMARVRIDPLPS